MLKYPFPESLGFLLLLSTFCGCISETSTELCEVAETDAPTVTFTLSVDRENTRATRDGGRWRDSYTTDPAQYDAVIDPEQVYAYLTDTKGNLVFRVEDLTCFQVGESETQKTYQYYGEVPVAFRTAITNGTKYRCIITANTSAIEVSGTPADTKLGAAQFDLNDLLSTALPANDYKIPMWGVGGFEWNTSKEVQSVGDVSMLRAAAKCRIHLSDDLVKAGYTLGDVKLYGVNGTGNVWPNNWEKVDETIDLYWDRDGSEYGFNPTQMSATTGRRSTFWDEPGTDPGTSKIVYFPERDNSANSSTTDAATSGTATTDTDTATSGTATTEDGSPSNAKVIILKDGVSIKDANGADKEFTVEFKDYTRDADNYYTDLQRNHVYDFEVRTIGSDLTLNLTVANWEESSITWDFSEQISGDLTVEWTEGTYYSEDDEEKKISLLSGTDAELSFTIKSPVGATWIATLVPVADDTDNSFYLKSATEETSTDDTSSSTDTSDNSSSTTDTGDASSSTTDSEDSSSTPTTESNPLTVSGTVDGTKTVLKVGCSNPNNNQQHQATLVVYVRYANGTTSEVKELSGWTITQTMR
jgi:cytoskeletal protein RodZ